MPNKRQQLSSQMPLIKKIILQKEYLLNGFLMQIEVSYSGRKLPQKTFISKEGKQAPGFKTERSRLTLLFRANAAGLMIGTALPYL